MARIDSMVNTIAFFAVLFTAVWAVYSIGSYPISESPSGLVVVGVPAKMSNTVVIAGLALSEPIGEEIRALTSVHLSGLADGFSSTTEGSTKFRQTLRLYNTVGETFRGGLVQYARDNSGNLGDFLEFDYGEPAFEYEILFDSGLQGRLEGTDIPAFESTSIGFMGAPATIFKATARGSAVTIRLFTKGGDFEVRDSDITDNDLERIVKVNGKTINALARITGSVDGDSVRIDSITYRFLAYSKSGGDAYIPPKRGIRQFLREPEGLINPSFDIIYGGVIGAATAAPAASSYRSGGGNLFFDPSGGDRYDLIFTNIVGQTFKIPYLTLVGGTPTFGNGVQSLVVREGSSPASFNIDTGDYFITTNSDDINGVTNVVIYSGLARESHELYFDFLGGGGQTVVYDEATGRGTLNVKGTNYELYVDTTGASDEIVVDMNHDGSISGNTVSIVVGSGVMINPSSSSTIIRVPRRLFDKPPSADETTTINFFASGGKIDLRVPTQTSVTMYSGSDRIYRGMTTYGVQFTYDDRDPPSPLAIDVPAGQLKSNVAAVSSIGRVSKGGQSGSYVVITFERERFIPSTAKGRTSSSGIGVND